ncbi:MAG: tetratricopeptide repeat protein [Thermoanaerobaculia bacterium]
MPYTLNGIGTHYYGKGNPTSFSDTCRFCGRNATISSYDTRECVCIFFIPVIPLKKHRILDECSRCRKHHRIALQDFKNAVDSDSRPLREAVERNPKDPAARIALVQALLSFQMWSEAEREADAGLAECPSADLYLLAGQIRMQRNHLGDALPLFERAAALEPTNAAIQYSLGWSLFKLNRVEDAIVPLQRAAARSDDRRADYLLGLSFHRQQRWAEALAAFEKVSRSQQDPSKDKGLLRLIGDCKKRLNYPLSDLERKASRRVWPFGRKPRIRTSGRARSVSGPLVVGVLAFAAIVIAVGIAFWNRSHVPLYIGNGFGKQITVRIDGKSLVVPGGPPLKTTIAPGRHTLVALAGGTTIESFDAEVSDDGLWDALFGSRFLVYNPDEREIYRRARIGYAVRRDESTYDEEIIAGKRFFEVKNVDFVFTAPPDSIDIDEHAGKASRVAFDVAADVAYEDYGFWCHQQKQTVEALRLLRKAVAIEPCSSRARENLIAVIHDSESAESALAEIEPWKKTCPNDVVEPNRTYQDLMWDLGRNEELTRDYGARVAAHPDSAIWHYLYGRIVGNPEAALQEYRRASALDPSFILPHVGAAYSLLSLERYTDAENEYRTILSMKDHDPSFVILYAYAIASAGDVATASSELPSISHSDAPITGEAFEATWIAALLRRDWNEASYLIGLQRRSGGDPFVVWSRELLVSRLRGDTGKIEKELAEGRRAFRQRTAAIDLAVLIEQGKYEEASAAAIDPKTLVNSDDLLKAVYATAALGLRGDRNALSAAVARLRSSVSQSSPAIEREGGILLDALDPQSPLEPVIARARAREPLMLRHVWFMVGTRFLASGDPAAARGWFERSRRASSDFDFPYLAARGLSQGEERAEKSVEKSM